MRTIALTVRADAELISLVDDFARSCGVSRSDYLRQAIEEKNARTLAERIAFLSKTLGDRHQGINEELDDSLGDGLAGR